MKLNSISQLIWILMVLLFLSACGGGSGSNAEAWSKIGFNEDLSADFMKFYMQFHTDSAYQMEHILFPVDGLPPNADSTTIAEKKFKWTPEDWTLHQLLNNSEGAFKQEYLSVDDNTVIEYIIDPRSGFGMERRFSRLSQEWYLIYYEAMNSLIEGDEHSKR